MISGGKVIVPLATSGRSGLGNTAKTLQELVPAAAVKDGKFLNGGLDVGEVKYLAPLSTEQMGIFNVTFEPGCRNNWHIHHAKSGGGQILVCVGGRGYYQEWGKAARELHMEP